MKPMLLASGFVLAALTAFGARHQEPVPPAAALASLDGETLFRGIYFHEGPAADLAPSLGSRERQDIDPDSAAIEERVMLRLRLADPAFFTDFASELRSGSFVRVETALDRASARLHDASQVEAYVPGKRAVGGIVLFWLGEDGWFIYKPKPAPENQLRRSMLVRAIVAQLGASV